MTTEMVGLDFETYGACNLKTHGTRRYIQDPSFQPLIASLTWRDSKNVVTRARVNLFDNDQGARNRLREYIADARVVPFNAGFERQVLQWLGIDLPNYQFLDAMVVSLIAGGGTFLEAAAPQLLGVDKFDEGHHLMRFFCTPGQYQEKNGNDLFDAKIVDDFAQMWQEFGEYCDRDSELGLCIAQDYEFRMSDREAGFAAVTLDMNQTGWHVDMEIVEAMQQMYLQNMDDALVSFRNECAAPTLNLNSLKQMKEWCLERGIKATSFDEKHVASLQARLNTKLATMNVNDQKYTGYYEVYRLLRTKQILGGSALKKLQTIKDTAVQDPDTGHWRVHEQYQHAGAAQSLRSSGRSIQMQNLKQLGEEIADVDSMLGASAVLGWTNEELAQNMRQVFCAEQSNGMLIVGDLKSVESRGLAYLARADWKTEAFRQGLDIYKVQASGMYNVLYEDVTKTQRNSGKTGELSCGYQAGPDAVRSFAAKKNIEMSAEEAATLVNDWRTANPEIVRFWSLLDDMLHNALEGSGVSRQSLPDDMVLRVDTTVNPKSLDLQVKGTQGISVQVLDAYGDVFLRRLFLGCYLRGNSICYHRPTSRKSGDLWRPTFIDPKTKQEKRYSIYGGKLAGILTQSFCRELFFNVLKDVDMWVRGHSNLKLVGQFHDEIVLEWWPAGAGTISLQETKDILGQFMSDPGVARSFLLAADIKHDHRYTK